MYEELLKLIKELQETQARNENRLQYQQAEIDRINSIVRNIKTI